MRPEKKIQWNLDWKKPEVKEILAMTLPRFFIEKYGDNAEQKAQEFLNNFKKTVDTQGI